jgi:phenylacetic acid degradation operon negative regulatory protein
MAGMATLGNPAVPRPRKTKTTLLTILGGIVAPLGIDVWQETLVNSLTSLGASIPASRQVVARAVSDQWLTSHRVGRRSRMALTDRARDGLVSGHQRMLQFGEAREWSGAWLCVALSVPENSRALRHHLRTELGWLGFGSLGNGVWISPHPENERAILDLLANNEGLGGGYVFTSMRPASHSPQELAIAGWDLDGLRARYEAFITDFEPAAPRSPAERFSCWADLVTRWRHFPLFDPDLPEHVLPADWPRRRAFELFHRHYSQLAPGAEEFLRALDDEVTGG